MRHVLICKELKKRQCSEHGPNFVASYRHRGEFSQKNVLRASAKETLFEKLTSMEQNIGMYCTLIYKLHCTYWDVTIFDLKFHFSFAMDL